MTPASSAASKPRAGGEYRIGRYRVRARLGKGGMGVVYLGRDEALDRDVAIKTLRLEGSPDDESRGRFEIEAKAAARLQHPNIVTVFELSEDRGLPYIAMEFLGGEDLEHLLRSGEKLSTTERLDIVIQTLRGLDFAHNHRIVHRDIKPSNIRVLDDGGVKILDFGIAKVESTSVTRAGMMVGTPYYMSPEHIRGGVLDGRTDVFAVGVILHELFAGKRPFTADDPTRVLYRIVNEPHPRLPEGAAGPLTADVQRVIDKSLEKEADARYASAGQMADELTRLRDRYPTPELEPADLAALSQARRNLASQQPDPKLVETVEAIARAHPDATEAQRLRRLFKRKPSDPLAQAETAAFPELDATFGKSAGGEETVLGGRTISGSAETILQGGRAESAPPAPVGPSNAVMYGAVAALAAAASIAGLLYLNRGGGSGQPAKPTPTITEIFVPGTEATPEKRPATRPSGGGAIAPAPPTAAIPKMAMEIRSQPAGASVRIDRKLVGVTPLRAEVTSNAAHSVAFSLSGYQTREMLLELPLPPSIDATLSPEGPPATLVVESAYPLTVSVGGRVLASDKPGVTATLAAGAQEVLLEAPALFLKRRETVQLEAGGTTTLKAPLAGKIGVRATPDNCKIYLNGVFVDYPPILDRAIAAGTHVVTFEWPDGTKAEEKVQVQAGKPSYVMGRKP
ncbi:MAG: protein kinase [Vicinamibacteria bacterium]|nr:protein kinase [Vicinamibacteria bacterium]